MLGAGYLVFFKGLVNLGCQIDLNTLAAGFNSVDGAVVHGDPVRENIMGVQTLDKK